MDFYGTCLALPVTFKCDWFIEFEIHPGAHISIADEKRTTIRSHTDHGLTLSWEVEDIEASWQLLSHRGAAPGPIREHPWGAYTLNFYDPDGRRLEFWCKA